MAGHLGKYELLEQIGRGGMGVVYRARDPVLNREVALKVLPDVSGVDATELQRFYIEAQAIAALRHPNIVVIYELDHAGGTPFIAIEYLPGWSLADAIRDRRPYSDADKARIIGDVCLALAHAHGHGIGAPRREAGEHPAR